MARITKNKPTKEAVRVLIRDVNTAWELIGQALVEHSKYLYAKDQKRLWRALRALEAARSEVDNVWCRNFREWSPVYGGNFTHLVIKYDERKDVTP